MKQTFLTIFDGVAHEFFASLGKTVAVAVLAYAGFALDNAHVGLDTKNAAIYLSLITVGRAIVSAAKVAVDNAKSPVSVTTTVTPAGVDAGIA